MAGVEMRFTLDDRELVRQIEALIARGGNLRKPLDDVGNDMLGITQRSFELSRTPEGVPWLPSAAAKREGRKTLIDTGRLGKNQETFSWIVSALGIVFGTNVEYAAIHQFGGTIQRAGAHAVPVHVPDGRDPSSAGIVTFPARAFVGASEQDQQRWADTIAKHLAGPDAGAAA